MVIKVILAAVVDLGGAQRGCDNNPRSFVNDFYLLTTQVNPRRSSMPSIYFKSKVKTVSESCTLTLIIRHNLLVGPASDVWYAMKQPPPEQLDILLASQLKFTISGTLNGSRMSPESVMASRIAHHFAEYFRLVRFLSCQFSCSKVQPQPIQNADKLGINMPSEGSITDTGLFTRTAWFFPSSWVAAHVLFPFSSIVHRISTDTDIT